MRRVLVALLVLCVGCDDPISGSGTTNGAYTLRTINGSPLPYTIVGGSSAGMVIVDDVINLFQGGTYAQTRHVRATANGALETRAETGTFTLFGTSITFRINETGLSKVAIGDGTSMTFVEQGLTAVYRK